jgi:hypothetical protein
LLEELYQQEANERFVMLPKCELIDDYKPVDIYNLVLIKLQHGRFYDFVQTGVNMLLAQQGMSVKNSTSKSNTRESMLRLKEEGYIEVYDDASCTSESDDIKPANIYFIKTTDKSDKSLCGGREMYTKAFYNDIKKIMSIDSNYKYNLFSVYHAVVGVVKYDKMDESGKVIVMQSDRLAYPSIDTIAERTGLNRKTVMSCLEQLYEAEVLYSITVKVSSKKDRNFYCRWMYKDYINGWVKSYLQGSTQQYTIEEAIFEEKRLA